ncbi:Methionine--tRNA ligase, cytoplasmic, partial [Fragariocoptes setiger]
MTDAEQNGDLDNRAPRQGKRNILITSALPYVNNIPHLGNIVGSVLSGDVFARYCRLRDYQVLYVGGTDEYGTATETKALEENCTPQEICDKYHKLHASVYEWFKLSFDYFGRTTTEKQTELTQKIFTQLNANGYIKPKTTDQLFCEHCARFLADRFVNGTCPFCQYEDARGDQCEKCGKPMMDARDLKRPKCKLCKNEPVVKSSEHMFFHLDMIEPKLKQWFESISNRSAPPASLEGDSNEANHTLTNKDTHWTMVAKSITAGWFKEGLKPRPITRDLKWGTKVPLPGYENKVFYVWFDAPIGYLSMTANYTPHWKKWWQNEDVELFQFLGKDNVPFHSIMFPATLMATGEPWKLVDHICAVEYLNYENGKFSKSRSYGVFGSDVQETGIPADIWRFYLMYIRPESQDSSFCWDDFREKVNSELLNNLGNFINRSLTFVYKNFDATLKIFEPNDDDQKYMNEVGKHLVEYIERLERVQLRDGLKPILAIGRAGNLLIQANKPWVLIKGTPEDQARAQTVLYLACNTVALVALLLAPYMPQVSDTIRTQLCMSTDKLVDVDTSSKSNTFVPLLPIGHKIGNPSPLFTKIEADQVKTLKAKFSSM